MILGSRSTIHAGVNFVVTPMPILDRASCLRFQELLDVSGIAVSNVVYGEREFAAIRQTPAPLEIRIGVAGPQIGQLLIVAPQPGRPIESVADEAEEIARDFNIIWPGPQRQVLSCDATIRDLYETSSDHALIEIWERRLRQSPERLKALGRPVLGGGLRLVMPPMPEDETAPQIEVKIESYLPNTRKIFLETQFTWPRPAQPGTPLDPRARLEQVDGYIGKNVVEFVMEGQ